MTQLQPGQMLPAFSLPGADGMPHSPWDYKQREHLLLIFTQATTSEGRGLLRTFSQHYREFREENCAILAITSAPVIDNTRTQEELHLQFPLLADPQGAAIKCYTSWHEPGQSFSPSLVLADRYGAVQQQWSDEHEAELPRIEELLEMLQYLNRICTP